MIDGNIYSGELDALEVIDLKSYYPHNLSRDDLKKFKLAIARKSYRPIGFAAYRPPTTRTVQLMRLAVLPAYRNQGVATELIEYVITDTSCTKITTVLRESNLDGCKFLSKFGFKAVNVLRERFEDGEDGIYFVRKVE